MSDEKDSTVPVAVSTKWGWLSGQNLYLDGKPITECVTNDEWRGWMDACYFDGIEQPAACADPHKLDELYAEMHAAAREVDRVQGERSDSRWA